MRNNVLAILLLASFSAKSQENNDVQIDFRIVCGVAGMTSPEVQSIQYFTNSKNYFFLKKKLFGTNKAEAILSAISLSELYSKKHLILGDDDQNRINEIKKWNLKYSICYTCTGHYSGSINELLSDNWNESYILIRRALFESQ